MDWASIASLDPGDEDHLRRRDSPVLIGRKRRNRLIYSLAVVGCSRRLYDIPEGSHQLDPVLVVGGDPISVFVLCNAPDTRVCEELEGGPDPFGGRDVVGVLHTNDDPPDVLRGLHGTVGAFEGPDDPQEGLPGVDPGLDGLI